MTSHGLRQWCCLMLAAAVAINSGVNGAKNATLPPSHITLRAGVLHAPPFAIVDHELDGSIKYSGFQPDLLKRLSQFAKQQDNVTLEFEMARSPAQYGAALDLVANDCDDSDLNADSPDCQSFDLIVGDYYCNPDRSLRIDFTPSWLRTTMSTVKCVEENLPDYEGDDDGNSRGRSLEDYTTLTQASNAGATVCVPDGTYLMDVVMNKFPGAEYLRCPSFDDCVQSLKDGECVLYADDELLLRYRASHDASLEVTREQFNTQYLVWPLRHDLDPVVALYLKKWMYAAVANATLDDLYFQYFQKELCPVGTAGEHCEKPCDPVHGTADSRGVCVCESVKWTGDDCSIEVPEETNLIPTTLKVLSYVMVGINFAFIAGCGAWLYWKRNSAQVRVSQPFFLSLVLLGCGISSSTILAMGQESAGDGPVEACMAIPWLYSVGFSITFGSLFAKIRRVYKIFQSAATPGAVRKTAVTFRETIFVIGVVLLVDVLVLVIWTAVSPLEWQRTVLSADQFGTPLESEGHCTSDQWMAFAGLIGMLHLILLAFACYLCFVSRNIPTKFSEGKYVSIAMISNLQIFLVGVPILIILGASPQSSFFVRSVIIWMNDFVVVSLIFGNLIYGVHIHIEQAEPQAVKAAIGQAIQSFACPRKSEFFGSPTRYTSQHTAMTGNSPGAPESPQNSAQLSLNGSSNHLASPPKTSNNSHDPQAEMMAAAQVFAAQQASRNSGEKCSSQDARSQTHSQVSNANSAAASAAASAKSNTGSNFFKEFAFTKSELEEHEALRKGATKPNSGFLKPLPRSMMNSSVSTCIHANLGGRDVNRSSIASLSSHNESSSNLNITGSWAEVPMSRASVGSGLNRNSQICESESILEVDEEDSDEEDEGMLGSSIMATALKLVEKATDVLQGDRESWGGINLPTFSQSKLDASDRSADVEEGKKGMADNSRSSNSSSRRSLAPPKLPQDGPSRLKYANSRISKVRDEHAPPSLPSTAPTVELKRRDSATDSKITIMTGDESFHDETDLDDSLQGSDLYESRKSASRRQRSSDPASKPLEGVATSEASSASSSSSKKRGGSSSRRSSASGGRKKSSALGNDMDESDKGLYFNT